MHGVDTNVIVRYLIGDDPAQAAKARGVIGQMPVFVPKTVLLEVEWVLRGVYELPSKQIIPALRFLPGFRMSRSRTPGWSPRPWIGPKQAWISPMPSIWRLQQGAKAS